MSKKYEQLGILTEMSSLLKICRSTFIKHTGNPKCDNFTVKVTFQCQNIYDVFSPFSSYGSQFKSLKAGRRWHTYFTVLNHSFSKTFNK